MSGALPTSVDSLWHGRLQLEQPARGHGYRFNLDAVLLAGFAQPAAHVIDLASGVGVVGLLLLGLGKAERITAVELQPELADLAARNARRNGYGPERFQVVQADARDVSLEADGLVMNPPYFRATRGTRARGASGRDRARHERDGTLADLVQAAARWVAGRGEVATVLDAPRGPELADLMTAVGLADQRQRHVLPRPGKAPTVVLTAGRQSAARRVEEAALVVHGESGRRFTAEVEALVNGPGWAP